MSVLPELSVNSMQFQSKSTGPFFLKFDRLGLKFMWDSKGPRKETIVMKKKKWEDMPCRHQDLL